MKKIEEQILRKIQDQGIKYAEKNKKVDYGDVFQVLMHQSVYDAVDYIFDLDKDEMDGYAEMIFDGLSKQAKEKILSMEDIVGFIVEEFEDFNHRERYDIFGVTGEGWNSTYEIMRLALRNCLPDVVEKKR